jgi:sec-independent protein translocase protein TatB
MFEVGFWELVLIFGVGLVVLGPEKLPKVAQQLGRWAGQARRMARSLSSQIQAEIQPVESSLRSVDDELRKDYSTLRPEPGQALQQAAVPDVAADVAAPSGDSDSKTGNDTQA